jgi:hypothetical protein
VSSPAQSGFAFPESVETWGGLTKREYYAARAPISLDDARDSLKNDGHSLVRVSEILRRLAQMRFAYADAMIVAGKEPE